jgi:small-conductance mechanosensitive channel
MNISVGYGEDLSHVFDVINRVGNELANDSEWESRILQAAQVLRVDSFEDSGIEIKILGETKPMEQWAIMGELRLRLKKVFDEEGIEIPWCTQNFFLEIACRKAQWMKLLLLKQRMR